MSDRATVTLVAVVMVFALVTTSPWKGVSFVEAILPSNPSTADVVAPATAPSDAQQEVAEDFETLVRMLRLSDPSMREHAATALGRLGDPRAVLPLSDAAINDTVAAVREHACSALGALGDARAVPALVRVLQSDPNARVREHAAVAIGYLRDPAAFEVLLQTMLGSDVEEVRAHAAFALGLLGDSRALGPLLHALQSERAVMRSNAAQGLGELGDARALGVLRQAEDDVDEQVRLQVREAIRKIQTR